MADIVIRVENVSKQYQLGKIGYGSLKYDLQSWFARIRGKEDPNALINDKNHTSIENFWALKDISFDVKHGDAIGIIGRNGAGKSTLLKILSRTTTPTKGCIKSKGRIASLLEVGTGFHPDLTGRENVYLNGTILGMNKKEIDKKFDSIVAFSGIEKFVDTPVKRYSSGMYIRLAFSVSSHLDSDILILDEVLAVGDVEFQRKCLEKMEDVIKHQGKTILFVSHHMHSIKNLCNHVIWLERGQIYKSGDTNAIVHEYMKSVTSAKIEVSEAESIYEINPDKDLQLKKARLINAQGKTTRFFNCDEKINIELNIFVKNKTLHTYGYLYLKNNLNEVVLVADSSEFLMNMFDNLNTGENIVTVTIPARVLASGDYGVYLILNYPDGSHIDDPELICSFQLDDLTTLRGNNRGGYFSAILEWQIKKEAKIIV